MKKLWFKLVLLVALVALNSVIAMASPVTKGAVQRLNLSQITLDSTDVTATGAELNYLDITTLGTGAASKAVVLDSGDDYIWPSAGFLTYGATQVTANGAELNYLDLTTLGTLAASKGWTSDASLDTVMPTGGLLTVQSGGGLTLNSGSVLTVDSVAVNHNQLSLHGRVDITICGDGTTINNNTVYYGPSMVPAANALRTCDIAQVGNVTEATADAPALEGTAFQVLSMDCLTVDPGAAGVSFTLRSAEGATTPSVTCAAANTDLGCTADIQTTTAIASGATLAIAAASTGDQGATGFACTIHAAY